MTSERANALNDLLESYDTLKYKPQGVKNVESMLEGFYDGAGKNPKDSDRFNSRVKLTPEQEEELDAIADTLLSTNDEIIEQAQEKYEKYKNKYGWESVEDAFIFTDRMAMYGSDALLRSVLSSEQILALFEAGEEKGLTEDEVSELAYIDYSTSGLTYDDLYNRVLGGIMTYDEASESWN